MGQLFDLDEVLQQLDIRSIHLPAVPETEHLICKENIQKMKDGVFLINTARGSIVNEKDVVEAIKTGKIGGFGTDVFEKEPVDVSGELFQFPNYIATPHVAAETYENCEATSIVTAKELLAVFEGKEPEHRLV